MAAKKVCGNCRFFRNPEHCPRIEWKPSAKNRWGIHLNHIACLPSDSVCPKFQPKTKKRVRDTKRVFERQVEALQ